MKDQMERIVEEQAAMQAEIARLRCGQTLRPCNSGQPPEWCPGWRAKP